MNQEGQYYVEVTMNGGCVVKSNIVIIDSTLTIEENIIVTGIINLFSNPAENFLDIEFPNHQKFNLQIFDITGRKIYEKENVGGLIKIDCASFDAGIYFVQAVNEKTVLSGKFVKE